MLKNERGRTNKQKEKMNKYWNEKERKKNEWRNVRKKNE